MLVIEPDTGKVVYARAEKTALNAASNVKIVTSAAALALLGPEYRWKTAVDGPSRPGVRCTRAASWPAISTCAARVIRP